jgi:hypothetical protein
VKKNCGMMVNRMTNIDATYLDARTFQHQLGQLADAMAYKVDREAVKTIKPAYTSSDIYIMLRQSLSIYNLLCFVNADEMRKEGYSKVQYGAAVLLLIRTMIDCLYNITVILTYPAKRYEFREVGYKWALEGLLIKNFSKRLTLGFWREYSGISHATFNGLMPIGIFYAPEKVVHEKRNQFDEHADNLIALHVSRAAGILICILTEIQAHFLFEGGNINSRLHEIWNALIPMPEIKELYDARYAQLLKDKGITSDLKSTA